MPANEPCDLMVLYSSSHCCMTPMQAIETGTINAAALLGMEDEIGRLATGMAADIGATDQSPFDDISVLQNITFVMKGGVTCLRKSCEPGIY